MTEDSTSRPGPFSFLDMKVNSPQRRRLRRGGAEVNHRFSLRNLCVLCASAVNRFSTSNFSIRELNGPASRHYSLFPTPYSLLDKLRLWYNRVEQVSPDYSVARNNFLKARVA